MPDWQGILTGAADQVERALVGLKEETWAESTGHGADGSPSARVDTVAEEAAMESIASRVVDVTFVSEEIGVVGGGGDLVVIIDPVDGSRNALRRIPYWAFSVAVFEGSVPVAALVRNVPAGIDYMAVTGGSGGGLSSTVSGRTAGPSAVSSLRHAAVGIQRPAYPEAIGPVRALLMSVPTVRVLGAAALDVCLVGAGGLDGYLNPNTDPGMPFGERVVDYAAAAVFTVAAGGVVTDSGGAPLAFPPDPTYRSAIVAAGTPALHEELLALVGGSGA